ncbi:C15orf41 family protein [Methanolobus psychrotolerans]|uniref:C15orf41 family protein n=1 Tax=Methanolobus psychrotolerans TaxID=1874706 RepID=UPI001F5E2E80|nr:C15orf41 family protein [Methanolobus psychrotolerans]
MRMDIETYTHIYDSLGSVKDVKSVAKEFSQPVGTIHSILNQKTVTKVKRNFTRVKNNSARHFRQWQKGKSISEIARNNDIPETLMVSMILKEMGLPKKGFIRNLDEYPEGRLKKEVMEAMESDFFFSPKAHDMHAEKGKLGESILAIWLTEKELTYRSEDDLRSEGFTKTPDFLLDEELDIDGVKVSWIESKALFGDEKEHDYYIKKQFREYEENYGIGMIVYWYGFIDTISFNGNIIKDYEFFDEGEMVEELLNFKTYW